MVQKIKVNIINKASKINKSKKINITKEPVSAVESEPSSTLPYAVKICEKFSKISLYLLALLLPIFFLPWTTDALDFNKQALLIVLVFISFFSWLLKVLISGKLSFYFNWIHIPVIVLFLVFVVSAIFSLYPHGSFWGWPQAASESLLTLFGFILFYFLLVNIFAKKEIFYLLSLFVVSSALAMLYGGLQLFGKFFLPFSFTQTPGFNTIGVVNGLAVFGAVLLPLAIFLLLSSQKIYLKIIFILATIISAFLLVLVNSQTVWWLVIAGSVLMIVLWVQKRDLLNNRWLVLPMFFLVMALFFALFGLRITGLPERTTEVSLTNRMGFNIGFQTLRESPVFALFGSGPGTFVYNFSKYKNPDFNQSPFWNIRFDNANSRFLTLLSSVGIIGILSFLFLIFSFFFWGFKAVFKTEKKEPKNGVGVESEQLILGVWVSFIILCFGFFVVQWNLSLGFAFFLLMAGLISLSSSGPKKEFILKPSSLPTLGFTFGFILIFIFFLGVIFLAGKKYIGEMDYLKGIMAWQRAEVEQAINYLERAANRNPKNDLYLRELSQVYFKELEGLVRTADLSQDEISQRAQILIYNSINSAKMATDVNPANVANWSVRGFIYRNLIGLVSGAKDWALMSYQEALSREPANPYFPTQAGISLLSEVGLLTEDKKAEREKLLSNAQGYFNKAIELKPDYAPAHFQLAIIYQEQGKQEEMITELEKTRDFAPFDVGLAFQLGIIYYQNGEYQKARNELERAISIDPNYANALYFLGLTYDRLGDKVQAIEKIKKVLSLNPDNQEIKKVLENLKAGLDALAGMVEEVPPQAPIKEEYPEIEE